MHGAVSATATSGAGGKKKEHYYASSRKNFSRANLDTAWIASLQVLISRRHGPPDQEFLLGMLTLQERERFPKPCDMAYCSRSALCTLRYYIDLTMAWTKI